MDQIEPGRSRHSLLWLDILCFATFGFMPVLPLRLRIKSLSYIEASKFMRLFLGNFVPARA